MKNKHIEKSKRNTLKEYLAKEFPGSNYWLDQESMGFGMDKILIQIAAKRFIQIGLGEPIKNSDKILAQALADIREKGHLEYDNYKIKEQ